MSFNAIRENRIIAKISEFTVTFAYHMKVNLGFESQKSSYRGFNVSVANQITLSYDVASGSKIKPCNKIDKPLVGYRSSRNVMTSITTLLIMTKL